MDIFGESTKIEKCFNLGKITDYQSTEDNTMIGGICVNSVMEIDSCYNRGIISLTVSNETFNKWPNAAGIMGQFNDRKKNDDEELLQCG